MDKLHISLIVLLGIAIVFLGIGFIKDTPIISNNENTQKEEYDTWSTDITPFHLNNIADHDWIAQQKTINETYISGSELTCLNICGNRCLWLGYTYKNHTIKPGYYPWGDKENVICGCECYIIKK